MMSRSNAWLPLAISALPSAAHAGWGDDAWGEMLWGGGAPVAVPIAWWLPLLLAALILALGVRMLRRSRTSRLGVVLLVVAAVPVVAAAATISVPYVFSNGTIADANEVNANFDALVGESNDQDARLDSLESASFLPIGSTLTCAGTQKVTGISPGTGDVVCGSDIDSDTNAKSLCGNGTFLNGSGSCDPGFLDADGVDAYNAAFDTEAEIDAAVANNNYSVGAHTTNTNAATICANGTYLNGDGSCDLADASGICSSGRVCTGGHAHSASAGSFNVSGNLTVSGQLSLGGSPFSAASRGYLALFAFSGFSCSTVCSSHSLDCSTQTGPFAIPAMGTTTCGSTTATRLCACWRL